MKNLKNEELLDLMMGNKKNNEYLVFIDDSGKPYDNNNFTIYAGMIFDNKEIYKNFSDDFWELLKKINNGVEIKGTKFWTTEITWENKIKVLSLLKKHNINNNIHLFSFVMDKTKLKNKFNSDNDCESILNKSIAMLCDHISNRLNIKDSKFILKIDEQTRNYYNKNNNNDINKYLNYHNPYLLSIKNLREKNIIFDTDDKHISSECPGIMFADIIANGINRMHNKYSNDKKEILEFIYTHTNANLENNFFNWPLKVIRTKKG